jgi:transposase
VNGATNSIFVLRTNTDLDPLAAMLCYEQLWTVEQILRTAKHLLSTRPIFHKLDETIRGHVFRSFLALVLKKRWRIVLPRSAAQALGRRPTPISTH